MRYLLLILLSPLISKGQQPEVFKRAEKYEDSFFLSKGYTRGIDSFKMTDDWRNLPDTLAFKKSHANTWWVNYDSTKWCFRYYIPPIKKQKRKR